MSRIENTEGLFGSDNGGGTIQEIECDWCKTLYPRSDEDVRTPYVEFGDLKICECCFEKVEIAVMLNMPKILSWFIRILEKRKKSNENFEKLVSEVKNELMK